MVLKILGSSSAGNCYILQANNGECLILDIGVSLFEVKKAIGFNIQNITSICVTHSHLDHCKYAADAIRNGITINCLKETADAIGINGHRVNRIVADKMFSSRSFKIQPFRLNHDVECVGFLISHTEMGICCFLTDSYYSEYKFKNLNQIIVEANYSEDILEERLNNGASKFLRDRTIRSHMSLRTCKDFLKANDLKAVHNIVLAHLSNNNSNAAQFKKEVQDLTGKTVHVAEAGMVIENFDKEPF